MKMIPVTVLNAMIMYLQNLQSIATIYVKILRVMTFLVGKQLLPWKVIIARLQAKPSFLQLLYIVSNY